MNTDSEWRVPSLPIYVMASDAFLIIHHETYFGRAWCLVEVLFSFMAKEIHQFPDRFILNSSGILEKMGDQLIHPSQGQLTNDNDRRNIRFYELIAGLITESIS